MAISEKMIVAAANNIPCHLWTKDHTEQVATGALTAAIDAAWTPFDRRVKSTWPDVRYAGQYSKNQFRRWLVVTNGGHVHKAWFEDGEWRYDGVVYNKVVAYLDPADLLPSFIEGK